MLLVDALAAGEAIVAHLRAEPAALEVAIAGSARRGKETVGDVDVVAASRDSGALSARLVAHPLVKRTLARGGTR